MQLFRRLVESTVMVKDNEATKLAIGAHSRYRRHRASSSLHLLQLPLCRTSRDPAVQDPRKSTDTSEDCRWNVTLIDMLRDGAWK
jgi:hypothetical protein